MCVIDVLISKNTLFLLYTSDKTYFILGIHIRDDPRFVVCPVDGAAAELLRDDVRRATGSEERSTVVQDEH